MAESFTFEIKGDSKIISTEKSGWTLELNEISWNGRSPKYDIRTWAPNHEKMGKGVTLTKEDLINLKNLLNQLNLEENN